jgi:hypothetical protein
MNTLANSEMEVSAPYNENMQYLHVEFVCKYLHVEFVCKYLRVDFLRVQITYLFTEQVPTSRRDEDHQSLQKRPFCQAPSASKAQVAWG